MIASVTKKIGTHIMMMKLHTKTNKTRSFMLNLVRRTNDWVVSYVVSKEIVHDYFPTIEQAAEFMNKMGVQDDEIDAALVDIFAFQHTRAIFSDFKFAHTEES